LVEDTINGKFGARMGFWSRADCSHQGQTCLHILCYQSLSDHTHIFSFDQ
jgi:hypothetical protein